jgi:hypothetical protein
MRQLAFALAALILAALPWGSRAQTTLTAYVFATVDAVEAGGGRITITGIEEGAAAPSTRFVNNFSSGSDLETCHRMALLAMSKPGQYLLAILPYQSLHTAGCKLTRVNP